MGELHPPSVVAEIGDSTAITFSVLKISIYDRCSSVTGRSGGNQTMSLGEGCHRKGVVIHELLHALGMTHEHCRADRNEFIRINMENIKKGKYL